MNIECVQGWKNVGLWKKHFRFFRFSVQRWSTYFKTEEVDLEIDRAKSIDRIDKTGVHRLSRWSKREVKSVDNIDLKLIFGSCADSAKYGEQ